MDEIIAHDDNTWSVGIKHPQQKGTAYTRSDLISAMLEEAERKGRKDMRKEAVAAVSKTHTPIVGTPYSAGPRAACDAIAAIPDDKSNTTTENAPDGHVWVMPKETDQ